MAKLSSLVVDLQVQTASLKKGLDEANQKLEGFGRKAEGVADLIKGAFAFAVIQQGVSKLVGFVSDGVKALAEEEKSIGRLSAAFDQLGYNSAKLMPYFEAQTAALEEETLAEGEAIRQMQQLMLQYGVAPSAIGGAVKAVLNYSAATGTEGVTATQQLMRAVQSGTGEFSRAGVEIYATGDATKDLTAMTAELEKKFGGSAVGATQGLAGEMGRLAKSADDLSKAMASFLVRTGISGKVTGVLEEILKGMTHALSDEHAAQKESEKRANDLTAARERLIKSTERLKTLEAERARIGSNAYGHDRMIAEERARQAAAHFDIAGAQAAISAASARSTTAAANDREAATTGASPAAKAMNNVPPAVRSAVAVGLGNAVRDSLADLTPALKNLGSGFYGTIATDFGTFLERLGSAASTIGNAALSRMPGISSALNAGMQGMAMGGPAGAGIGIAADLLTQSAQFASIIEIVNEGFASVADLVGGLLEPLIPLVSLMRDMAVAMKPLGALLGDILAPILWVITEALRWLYVGILTVANLLTGHGGDSLSDAVATLSGDMKGAAANAKGLATASAEATEEILNAASGFRIEAYRYNATDTSGSGGGAPWADALGPLLNGGSGGSGGPVIPPGGHGPGPRQTGGDTPITIILNGSTVRDMIENRERGSYRTGGTRVNLVPRYG